MQLCIYMFLRIILLSYVTHHSKFNSGVIANSITQVVRWTNACSNVDDRTQIRLTQPLVHCMSYNFIHCTPYTVRRTQQGVHYTSYSVRPKYACVNCTSYSTHTHTDVPAQCAGMCVCAVHIHSHNRVHTHKLAHTSTFSNKITH